MRAARPLVLATTLAALTGQAHKVRHGLVQLTGHAGRVAANLARPATNVSHGLGKTTKKLRYNTHSTLHVDSFCQREAIEF
jgi:hypothetical protein